MNREIRAARNRERAGCGNQVIIEVVGAAFVAWALNIIVNRHACTHARYWILFPVLCARRELGNSASNGSCVQNATTFVAKVGDDQLIHFFSIKMKEWLTTVSTSDTWQALPRLCTGAISCFPATYTDDIVYDSVLSNCDTNYKLTQSQLKCVRLCRFILLYEYQIFIFHYHLTLLRMIFRWEDSRLHF